MIELTGLIIFSAVVAILVIIASLMTIKDMNNKDD